MYTYIVFDVETPNRCNNRMSAIGITVVRDGASIIRSVPVGAARITNEISFRLYESKRVMIS